MSGSLEDGPSSVRHRIVSTPTSPSGSSKRYSATLLGHRSPEAHDRVGSHDSTSSCLDGERVALWTMAMTGGYAALTAYSLSMWRA